MRYGAKLKINPVILEFVRKEDEPKNKVKNKGKTKKLKFNDILVKVMFNLECGNILKRKEVSKIYER